VQGDGGPTQPKLSSLIGHFVGHVCLGSVGFIALAIPAILFSLAAHYLAEIPVSPLVIQVFLWIHYSLLLIDTGMFAAYISASIYGAVKELIRYVKGL
jgi:hypothetical protein